MNNKDLYEKLAKLAIRKGVNIEENQDLIIRANVRDKDFIRMLVKEAYEAKARSVRIDWHDEEISKMHYIYQDTETLKEIPDWQYDKTKYEQDHGACYLNVISDKPGNLKDIDSEKINAANYAYYQKMADLMSYSMNNIGQWCVIGIPSVEWAKVVFPNLTDEEAFNKLEEALFNVVRINKDNDPLKEWEKHNDNLINHAKKLNEYNFKTLHFTSELGTDLYLDLITDHIWVGGGAFTPKGTYFIPNMPTEEVFCMPKKLGVNGIVYASKPLSYNGKVIEEFYLEFKDGKVINYGAKKEEEALKKLLEFDEGSKYLGEVALVPYDSPISKSNILFFNTLYDENAACHLALGRPYPENIKDGGKMSEEELKEKGANDSMQHEDFMFGTKEMNIDGITYDEKIIPIFRKGNFII